MVDSEHRNEARFFDPAFTVGSELDKFPGPPELFFSMRVTYQTKSARLRQLVLAVAIFLPLLFPCFAHAEAYKWSVQYLIDNSQPVFGRSQKIYPRHNRVLAVSPDYQFLYAGYHHGQDKSGEVRKIDLNQTDYEKATVALLPRIVPKSLAVDSSGHVYIGDNETSAIQVYDSELSRREATIHETDCEGLCATKEGDKIVLYSTSRSAGTLSRWEIEVEGREVASAKRTGFDGSGVVTVAGARSLRGVAVDSKGQIWVADLEGNKVYRFDKDGKNPISVDLKTPMAIAFQGDTCLVTQYQERQITLLDGSMQPQGTLSVPWKELELSPHGNNHEGALSGIVVVPEKGFFVANETGQTAEQKSTYGRVDDNSDFVNGKVYMDAYLDDNEPILHATPIGQ